VTVALALSHPLIAIKGRIYGPAAHSPLRQKNAASNCLVELAVNAAKL
jgi:hypothetical protein